jgi:hypothetical protein
MTPHRYVVLAERIRGFDTESEARRFAQANVPSVICERLTAADGTTSLHEIARHDLLFDEARAEWRIMMG